MYIHIYTMCMNICIYIERIYNYLSNLSDLMSEVSLAGPGVSGLITRKELQHLPAGNFWGIPGWFRWIGDFMGLWWWLYGDFMVIISCVISCVIFHGDFTVILWWLYGDIMAVLTSFCGTFVVIEWDLMVTLTGIWEQKMIEHSDIHRNYPLIIWRNNITI